MSYTASLAEEAMALSPDDDAYTEKLEEVTKRFRDPAALLDAFLKEQGYTGTDTPEEKTAAFRAQMKAAGIPVPRDMARWYGNDQLPQRESAFRICFAYGLSIEETDDFFRRICLSRSFDLHVLKEAVYYFCLKKQYSWKESQEILKAVPAVHPEQPAELLYTGTIRSILDGMQDKEELTSWLKENADQFGVHHLTVSRLMHELWHRIGDSDGLAYQESRLLTGETGADAPAVVNDKDSVWMTYAQIMGLDQLQAKNFGRDRSLKKSLVNNKVMHTMAQDSFPDREGIQKVLKDKPISDERVRKLLILFVFYAFWCERRVHPQKKDSHDSERCFWTMNQYLLEAGFPELYYGNPYDWIFLWALGAEDPLEEFRYYMMEVLAVDSERKPEPENVQI